MNKPIPKLTVSMAQGSDPDGIDAATEAYGDGLTFDLKHLEGEHCERSASGLHIYQLIDGSYVCACCGADGGEA